MRRDDIDRSLEDLLDEKEQSHLREALLQDPEVLREYAEIRWLHAELRAESASLLVETKSTAPRPAGAWLARAAIVALLLLLGFAVLNRHDQGATTVATLVEADGCRWEGSDLPTREGAKLGPGTLALAEGMATIRFDSGAVVTLEAPTILEVESAMECRLVEGSVVADVPESAHGFRIETEKMDVIDLGTRFGVTTSEVGGSHVFVFDGEVEVHREEAGEPERLLGGKSLHLGAEPTKPDEEVFREVQPTAKEGNWMQITTDTGRGRDAYVRRGDAHGPTGGQPLLMVKHTELAPGNERRAVLTFDLAGVDPATLVSGRLALKIEASGLGFSSLVPDSKFSIHAVNDQSLEEWSEHSLLWKNGGPFVAEPIDSARFPRIAEFEIGKGASHGIVEASSPDLLDYVRSHAGGLATLLIVRETGEFDNQGLVHAFASKEHPTSPAPTLWLEIDSAK